MRFASAPDERRGRKPPGSPGAPRPPRRSGERFPGFQASSGTPPRLVQARSEVVRFHGSRPALRLAAACLRCSATAAASRTAGPESSGTGRQARTASGLNFRSNPSAGGTASPGPTSPADRRPPQMRSKGRTGQGMRPGALRTEAPGERPHGPGRSLTMHAPGGARRVGFGNTHPVREGRSGARRRRESGHAHRMRAIRTHECGDASTPPGDFRKEADAVPKARGVIP